MNGDLQNLSVTLVRLKIKFSSVSDAFAGQEIRHVRGNSVSAPNHVVELPVKTNGLRKRFKVAHVLGLEVLPKRLCFGEFLIPTLPTSMIEVALDQPMNGMGEVDLILI